MALIKCTNCGHQVSDKAVECPKCGTLIKREEPEIAQKQDRIENAEIESPQSKVPIIDTATPIKGPVTERKSGKNGLMIAFGVIVAIAIISALFFLKHNKNKNNNDNAIAVYDTVDNTANETVFDIQPADPVPVQEEDIAVVHDDPSAVDIEEKENVVENTVEEDVFLTNNDVLNFVCGNRYTCNNITIVITEDGIYANDNKLGDNPRFRRLSKKKGTIKTSEISITVNRENNTLIDNKSGDIYYRNYY